MLAVGVPSPCGAEQTLAERLAEWVRARRPSLPVEVDRFAAGRANLVVGEPSPGHLVLYGHLDTTLSGDPLLDRPIVPHPPEPFFERSGDRLTGPGLGVAKGPAAAALLGYVVAAQALAEAGVPCRAALLLAAGGTHRAAPAATALPAGAPASGAGDGVRRYLARSRPAAAVVAKCGPPGVLYEEPGAAYVNVEVTGSADLAMFRASQGHGGVPAAVGAAVEGIEAWRRQLLARPAPARSQIGRDAALGALAAGLPYKADLVAGLLQLHVYAVLGWGDTPAELAADLEAAVRRSLVAAGHGHLVVRARVAEGVLAAGTPPDAPVVRLAQAAYLEAHGVSPPAVEGWTGSTDGVLLRHAGVETARMGPVPLPGVLGRESLSLAELSAWVRAYAAVVAGWSGRFAAGGPAPTCGPTGGGPVTPEADP